MVTIRQAQIAVLSQSEVQKFEARPVCEYIDMTIIFGRDFDTGKRFRWAKLRLGNR